MTMLERGGELVMTVKESGEENGRSEGEGSWQLEEGKGGNRNVPLDL